MKEAKPTIPLTYSPTVTQNIPKPVIGAAHPGVWIFVRTISLIFLLALTVPFRPAAEADIGYLDYSWMAFLHEAISVGRQFGKQVIYTYGPLGFIATSVYDPHTFIILLICRILLAVGVFVVLWESARKYFPQPLPALPWLMAIGALMADSPDHFYPMCAVLLLWSYFVVQHRKLTRSSWILIVILAAASLMKVNLLMQSIVAVGAVGIDQVISGGRRRLIVPIVFAACIAVFYLASGQSPGSAGAFIWSWAIVSGGYIDAVALPGVWLDAILYLAIATATLLLVADFHWRRHRWSGFLPVAALLGIFALLFKHSFVRQDFAHVTIGPMVVLAVAVLYLPIYWRDARGQGRRVAGWVTVTLGALITSSIQTGYHNDNLALWAQHTFPRAGDSILAAGADLFQPSHLGAQREKDQAQLRHDNIVPLTAVSGTVDIYPHRLDVLFAYHLPYAPRPAVQSLIAMAPPFARLDADHLLEPRAAQTILFDIDVVDGNFLSLLDGLSWPNLLTRYDVIDTSGDFLVLRKSDHPRSYALVPLQKLSGKFDAPFVLPDTLPAPLWARIHFKKSLAGRLISAAYKPPTMGITVHTADGADSSARLIPGLAESGFLLSPLIRDRSPGDAKRRNRLCFAQLASKSWQKDLAGSFVQSVTISIIDAPASTFFDDEFSVEIDRLEFPRQELPIEVK